jgi:hypothetical protein
MPVVVKDQTGSIVATAPLGTPLFDGPTQGCVASFTVENVPDAPFYSIEVGHRGAITYSNADLAAKDWHVDLTLGAT